MTKIGFIGLGIMGNPMAQNLLKNGIGLTVYDIKPAAMEKCINLGAEGATALSDMRSCNIVFIMVNTGQQVENVIFGENGLAKGLGNEHSMLIIVMSTVSLNLLKKLDQKAGDKNIKFIDAPVSGGPTKALLGQLTFMLGGANEDIKKVIPMFNLMGDKIFRLGPLGSGISLKLINNAVFLSNMCAFSEALAIGVESGLDIEEIASVLSVSTGKNWCSENLDLYKEIVVLSQKDQAMPAIKDIKAVIEWAEEMELNVPSLRNLLTTLRSFKLSEKLNKKIIQKG